MEYIEDDNTNPPRTPQGSRRVPIPGASTAPENTTPAPAPAPTVRRGFFERPVIAPPKQGVHIKDYVEANQSKPSVSAMLSELLDEKRTGEMKKDTAKKQRVWKWPYTWKSKIKKASKNRDAVLVMYFTIKGELETFIVPIYGGNMVIIRNKVYEFDPRAIWTTKIGFKFYKILAIKEIDRRPISNLDLDEVRKRGDSTDSDEFLIKAALKAQVQTAAKAVGRGLIILIAVIVIGGLLVFFFTRK
jgi:hypothetical protein